MLHELYSFKIFYYISLFIVYMCTYNSMCGGQKTTCRCQFPPSIMWELNSVNLVNPVSFRNFLGLVIYVNYVNYFLYFMSPFPLSRKECLNLEETAAPWAWYTLVISVLQGRKITSLRATWDPAQTSFLSLLVFSVWYTDLTTPFYISLGTHSFCSLTVEMVALMLFFVNSIFCWLSQFGLLDLKSHVDYASLQVL